MDDDAPPFVELLVCVTCRAAGDESVDESRSGARLYAALEEAGMPEGVVLRGVECLSNCTRGCSVGLRGGDARWSYLYGFLDPGKHVDVILDGAAKYRATGDGLVPWRARPEHFRKNCMGRMPPVIPQPATPQPAPQKPAAQKKEAAE